MCQRGELDSWDEKHPLARDVLWTLVEKPAQKQSDVVGTLADECPAS
jgi:hypothetical protein